MTWHARLTTVVFSLSVAVLALPAPAAPPEAKRAFTVADLYRLKQVQEPAVSPDGRTIAYRMTSSDLAATRRSANVWRVSPDGSDARALTRVEDKNEGAPRFAADGQTLVFLSDRSGDPQVWFLPTGGGEAHERTDFPGGVGSFVLSPDGRWLAFTADVRGRTPLHELELATGTIRVITDVGTLDAFAVAPDGTWAVLVRRRVGEPQELWRVDLTGPAAGDEKRLTTHNAAVEAEVDIRPAEEITVSGADGHPVQVFVVKPHGFDPARKYPLILNLHGGPQMQWADAFRGDWQVYPGAGYVVAFPNPHGSTGFGQAYTREISGDWDGKVMVDIDKVADALAALPYVDPDRMGLMGWSWGGYAVMWMEGHSTRYKAMASMMGVYDLRAMVSATEELWFPLFDLGGDALGQPRALPGSLAFRVRVLFPNPLSGDHGRPGLPRPLHPVADVLHRPAAARRPLAAAGLGQGRALASLVRDGPVLHRPPRLVPQVARGRPRALGPRRAGEGGGVHGADGGQVGRPGADGDATPEATAPTRVGGLLDPSPPAAPTPRSAAHRDLA